MTPFEQGMEAIDQAARKRKMPSVVIEMTRNLGDVLHSTLVVRHFRTTDPASHIVWAIGNQYVDTFARFTPDQGGPHAIASLPDLPPFPGDRDARVAWVKESPKLRSVHRAIGCGVHPWGWVGGSIVDGILHNAGIRALRVSRQPWLPITAEDVRTAETFMEHRGLRQRGFVALEYESYSLKSLPLGFFAELVAMIQLPVVALAAPSAAAVPGAIDGRSTTIRQAKALIARSACFVGCGSGLSVVAASNQCHQPVLELVTPALSMPALGYRRRDQGYANCHTANPRQAAAALNQIGVPIKISRLRA